MRRSIAWREELRGWGADLAAVAAIGVLMGLLGPFGSYFNGPAWQRVGFQLTCALAGVLLYGAGVRAVLRLGLRGPAMWAAVVVLTAILSAPFSWAAAWLARQVWPFLTFLRPIDWYLQALVTAEPIVLGLAWLNLGRIRRWEQASEAGAAEPSHQGLLGTDPSRVLCLHMEDHYVRIHTAAGSRLVLATLGQAIAALEGAEGLQVHRSWWVARNAVQGVEQHGRNLRIRLAGGLTAPVARSAVPQVRAAGWMA